MPFLIKKVPSKTFSYKVVITNTIDNRGVTSGTNELEKQLTKTEKRILKQIELLEKYQKTLDKIGESKNFTRNLDAALEKTDATIGRLIRSKESLLNPAKIIISAPNLNKVQSGLEEVIFQLVALNKTGQKTSVAPRITEVEKAANKAAAMVLKFDNQLAKLKGNDTELAKLNRTLSQPGVAAKIDDTTKALLRQKAAAVDAAKIAKPSSNGSSLLSAASEVGNIISGISNAITTVASFTQTVISAGESLFNLVKEASDYGSAIFDVTQKTGQSAETVSALKIAAEQSGSSLEQISGSITKYSKLVGTAAEGSKEARESLIRLGVDPQKAVNDLDGSLDAVFKTIYNSEDGVTQIKLATEAFGKSGADIIPIIKQMGGNFAEFKKNAEAAGLTLSDADARAADEFGDTLTALQTQIKSISSQVLLEFAPDITKGMEIISKSLADNKDNIHAWAVDTRDELRGLVSYWNDLTKATENFRTRNSEPILERIDRAIFGDTLTDANKKNPIGQPVGVKIGEDVRNSLRLKGIQSDVLTPSKDLSIDPNELFRFRSKKELDAESAASAQKTLEEGNKVQQAIAEQNYKVQEALLNGHLRYTLEQQKQGAVEQAALKANYLNGEIVRQVSFFDKEIAAAAGNADEIKKIQSQKTETLAKLNGELKVNEVSIQNDIRKYEQQIFAQRRQSAIEFKNLGVQQIGQLSEKQIYAVQQSLDNQTTTTDEGYKNIIEITKNSYEKISEITRQQLNLQLKDLSLTPEQRLNILAKGYLDEQKAAEENSRAIKEIEKKRTAAILQEIQERTEAQLKFISNAQIGADNLSIFGDVGGISLFNNFGKLLEKAKDLKEFFDSSNRGQADYLKNQSDYYGNLLKTTQAALEKLQNQRENMISEASSFPAATTDLATGDLIPAAQVPQIDRRQAEADLKISELKDKLLQYKGFQSKFATLATQFNSYADGIDKTYGALQADIFNLYDSISKGVGDNTVFDQIIEKNYLAQRSLEQAALSAKVQGLANQLTTAQKALDEGSIAPVEFIRIQGELTQAEQALKAFNFQTDVGKEKLDTFANAAARFKKIIAGDKIEIEAIKQFGKTDLEKQKGQLAVENIILEQQYYKDADLLALQHRNKQLQYERDVFELRQELAQKSVFNEVEASAKILSHIEENTKSASDIFADAFIDAFDRTANSFDKLIDKIGVGKIPIIGDIVKAQSRNLLSSISQNLLGDIFPNLGNTNDPILDENKAQTKHLKSIDSKLPSGTLGSVAGGSSASSGGIFSLLKNALKSIFGGGKSNASATPNFNPNSTIFENGFDTSVRPRVVGTSGNSYPRVAGILDYFNEDGSPKGGAGGLSSIFGKGGIFGEKGFGNNVGTFGAIGTGASLLGGLVGGRFGGFLSGAGSGLAIGAQIGSIIPGIGTAIGAGVGALVGGLIGLFGGGTRKKDEKTRNQATLDALGAIDKLIEQVNATADFTDADGVIAQGAQIRQSYLDTANSLKDKKTRNIALKDVSRIDEKLRALETLAKTKAGQTKSRAESLVLDVPTFSDGGSVSDFLNKNFQNNPLGYIQGAGSARSDSINAYFPQAKTFARISNSEYVLDGETTRNVGVAQLDALRATKGRNFDRLKYVKTPYAYADGGAVSSPSVAAQLSAQSSGSEQLPKVETHIYIQSNGGENEIIKSETYWTSPEGKRVLIDTVEQDIYRGGKDSKVYKAIVNVGSGNR